MKILFLSPPQNDKNFPSLGIAYIVSVLNKNGHEAFLHDGANSSIKEMMAYVEHIKPQIVGITMNTTNRFEALELARLTKQKYNIPIILGGPHPTLVPDQILKNYDFIDFIVRNEGEYVTLNLINALEKNLDTSKILGISFKKNNEIINNPQAPVIENLDELPFPEWKFFDLKKYVSQPEYPEEYKKHYFGSIISSRGCPFRCTFCSSSNFWGYKIRFRSAKNVVDEMKMLFDLGIRFLLFNDDNFTSNKKRAIEICKLIIKEGLNEKMGWQCRAEVNIIDEELLGWMKKANCNMIEFGVEDCTEAGIRWFKKGHTKDQTKKAFDLCKKYGIKTKSCFIVGGEHETKENIKLKKEYIEELNPDVTTASILIAYPKTEVYELGKKKGLWDDDIWLKECIGEKYHSRAPIYTGPNLSYSEVSAASADILYWWMKKKGQINFKDNLKIALRLLKLGDFKKLSVMTFAVLKQKVK
jgi:anaerobic magnesium-protoporphyrin IX monomethyl ester cyclase